MSSADQHQHRSIGEVLGLLQEEYPDVTISKIRFLESQGLIAPERTASGFRKFYDSDIQRLRWILCKQSDHFLPLKVIKKMLDEGADTSIMGDAESQQTLWPVDESGGSATVSSPAGSSVPSDGRGPHGSATPAAAGVARTGAADGEPSSTAADGGAPGAGGRSERAAAGGAGRTERARPERTRRPSPTHPSIIARTMATADTDGSSSTAAETGGADGEGDGGAVPETATTGGPDHGKGDAGGDARPKGIMTPADIVAALQEDPRPGGSRSRGEPRGDRPMEVVSSDPIRVRQFSVEDLTSTSGRGDFLSAEEVCEMFDVEQSLLDELEKFGLIAPRRYGGTTSFDGSDIEIIAVSVRYAAMGVEPRHLRMYKIAAEREAGFVEQLVLPILKQRNPTAKQNAAERSSQLASMGDELHNLILRRHLRNLLDNR